MRISRWDVPVLVTGILVSLVVIASFIGTFVTRSPERVEASLAQNLENPEGEIPTTIAPETWATQAEANAACDASGAVVEVTSISDSTVRYGCLHRGSR